MLVHEVDAEFGAILDYWTTPPDIVTLQEVDVIDVLVQKHIDIVNDKCNDSREYNYHSKVCLSITI
jgi:hypothetical protein